MYIRDKRLINETSKSVHIGTIRYNTNCLTTTTSTNPSTTTTDQMQPIMCPYGYLLITDFLPKKISSLKSSPSHPHEKFQSPPPLF